MRKDSKGYSIFQSEAWFESLIFYFVLGCILGVEAIPLRFHLFPKLWVEVKNKSHEVLSYLAIIL